MLKWSWKSVSSWKIDLWPLIVATFTCTLLILFFFFHLQETHIIHTFEDDFYGSELSVVILGFIRPEKDFPSLGQLSEVHLNPPSCCYEIWIFKLGRRRNLAPARKLRKNSELQLRIKLMALPSSSLDVLITELPWQAGLKLNYNSTSHQGLAWSRLSASIQEQDCSIWFGRKRILMPPTISFFK